MHATNSPADDTSHEGMDARDFLEPALDADALAELFADILLAAPEVGQ